MDLQTMLNNALTAQRAEDMKSSAQLTLGELILKLESCEDSKRIVYDFGKSPGQLASWRGSYSELALSYGDEEATVKDILDDFRSAIGATFEGYKGGDFVMGRATPVWIANYGDSSLYGNGYDTTVGIVDIKNGDVVTIITQAMEY